MQLHKTETGLIRFSPIDQSIWAKQEPLLVDFISNNYEMIIDGLNKRKEATRRTYKSNAPDFIHFIQENGLNIHTPAKYWQFMEARKDIGAQSKNLKMVTAKAILRELYLTYQFLPIDLSQRVEGFRKSNDHTKAGFTPGEMKMMKGHISGLIINEQTKMKGLRLRVILSFMAFQGLRISEVANLSFEDIDRAKGGFWVKGKARDAKEFVAFLGPTERFLEQYLYAWEIKRGPLFFSPKTNKQLTKGAISAMFVYYEKYKGKKRKYGLLPTLGIEGKSCHSARHYFITSLLIESNGNIPHVQRLARIKNAQTVMIYNDEIDRKKIAAKYKNAFIW